MPPRSNRPDVYTGQARTIHDCDQNEKSETSKSTEWVFKVRQMSEYPHTIHITKPDNSCKSLRNYYAAAFYVNIQPVTFSKKVEESQFTEFLVWPDDLGWHIYLYGYDFSPGDILEFTTSRGSSRPYPVEIAWKNKPKAYWRDSMGKAERSMGVYRGWFSESSKLNQGKSFTRRVTPWMDFEPYNDSLTENMHAAWTPSRAELEHGVDSKTGGLLLFIEKLHKYGGSGYSRDLIPHEYAVVKGKPVNGQTPFMVLNVAVKRCRMYECESEVTYDMKITDKTFENYLRSFDDEGVLWLKASKIGFDRDRSRPTIETCKKISIKSPVRIFHVDPQVMITQYQGNSLAEANFRNFNTTINTPGRTKVELNVESGEHGVKLDAESVESEVDSDVEIIESEDELDHEAQCEAENGTTSVFMEDATRNQIHGLFKFLYTRHSYYLVKGVPSNGEVPYMILNATMDTCRMYDCASEVAADMRITEKEFERLLRMCMPRGNEGKLRLEPSAINFIRVRCNWDFDARKKMGIQAPIRKFDYHYEDGIVHKFRTNSLTESDFLITYSGDSDY